jgi:N-methylhydantoinase A/oxoprolinase/acetone carboxylase beta subunit
LGTEHILRFLRPFVLDMEMTSSGREQSSAETGEYVPGTPAKGGQGGPGSPGRFSVDMDIGGTFTDVILSQRGFAKLIKVDTTPHDLSVCFGTALEKAAEELGFERLPQLLSHVQVIRLSTSLSTNMLLERKGLRIGLILERGWSDAFLRQRFFPQGSGPPVDRHMVLEVGNGNANAPSVEARVAEIGKAAYWLIREGADVLVISLDDPKGFLQEEKRAKGIIHQFYANHFIGSIPVVTGGQLSQVRDYMTRSSRIVFNTYAHGAVAEPFLEIEDQLRDHGYAFPLLLVHSDGGSSRVSKTTAEQTISSGASAGIFGAQRFSAIYGLTNVVTVDIGGTSTEIGVIQDGRIAPTHADQKDGVTVIGGLPIAVTVGIGGGSVVRVDETGQLKLGPRSVGAFPGPVCYDLGGSEATLTDAFLILGYFDEAYFLGGERRLNRHLAETVFRDRIADPLGVSCAEAAWIVKQEAVSRIAREVRSVLSRLCLEPLDTALFAVGGCGGCMGCDLCDASGLSELYVFRQGSVFGAYGSSGMDVVHRYEQDLTIPLSAPRGRATDVCEKINASVLALQRKAFLDMAAEGFRPEGIHFGLRVDVESRMSGVRRGYDCPSPFLWPGEWRSFRKKIIRLFETDDPQVGANHLRLTGIALTGIARIPHAEPDAPISPVERDRADAKRSIYAGGGLWVDVYVYNWDTLRTPLSVSDPCILESHDTTVIVPPGSQMVVDKRRNARIRRSSINHQKG